MDLSKLKRDPDERWDSHVFDGFHFKVTFDPIPPEIRALFDEQLRLRAELDKVQREYDALGELD